MGDAQPKRREVDRRSVSIDRRREGAPGHEALRQGRAVMTAAELVADGWQQRALAIEMAFAIEHGGDHAARQVGELVVEVLEKGGGVAEVAAALAARRWNAHADEMELRRAQSYEPRRP